MSALRRRTAHPRYFTEILYLAVELAGASPAGSAVNQKALRIAELARDADARYSVHVDARLRVRGNKTATARKR